MRYQKANWNSFVDSRSFLSLPLKTAIFKLRTNARVALEVCGRGGNRNCKSDPKSSFVRAVSLGHCPD